MRQQVTTTMSAHNTGIRKTISKSQLAKKLNVTRNTLLKFHREYAMEFVEDYFNGFPLLSGIPQDELPLSEYQAWVLSRMIHLYMKVPALLIQVELSKEEVLESFAYTSFSRLHTLNR